MQYFDLKKDKQMLQRLLKDIQSADKIKTKYFFLPSFKSPCPLIMQTNVKMPKNTTQKTGSYEHDAAWLCLSCNRHTY